MEKHYGFIYLTIDLKNGKGYVGQHKIRNQKTLDPQYIGSGRIIKDTKKKYGLKRFNRQILYFCENQKELDEMEIYYINYFNAVKSENFYNMTDGGNGGNKFTNKTKKEMKEIKENIGKSNSKSQKKRWEDEKEREKQSKTMKKRFEDPKEREKISITSKKRWEDKEFREKMSETHSGKNNAMYGKGYKIYGEKNGRKRSVYCKELDIVFSYVELAKKYCANILNIKIGQICNSCNGKVKSAGRLYDSTKLTWKWVEDVEQETLNNAEYIDSKRYEDIINENKKIS